jgi:hypothetical protein
VGEWREGVGLSRRDVREQPGQPLAQQRLRRPEYPPAMVGQDERLPSAIESSNGSKPR